MKGLILTFVRTFFKLPPVEHWGNFGTSRQITKIIRVFLSYGPLIISENSFRSLTWVVFNGLFRNFMGGSLPNIIRVFLTELWAMTL